MNYLFSLRSVTEGDMQLLYAWRNRPEVREYMYSSTEIKLSGHSKWFSAMLQDPSRHSLIMTSKGVDCAVILFSDIRGVTSCTWGFYAGPNAPAGVSLLVELAGLGYAFETLCVNRLHCEVLSGNQQVANLHKKSGFIQEGCLRQSRQTQRGLEDVIVFGMLKDEWPAARDRLQARAQRIFGIE
ncbi:UDP-4-amino-4,6-dideoxy-N-acetyl-beta-L-altrosamine N-acetyltransferase [bacterium]|nr:UDP-4-amino-4,6-dideoxy-N-acetyl-beta-L-altrosamine N-acetyltransferase [bacterium]